MQVADMVLWGFKHSRLATVGCGRAARRDACNQHSPCSLAAAKACHYCSYRQHRYRFTQKAEGLQSRDKISMYKRNSVDSSRTYP